MTMLEFAERFLTADKETQRCVQLIIMEYVSCKPSYYEKMESFFFLLGWELWVTMKKARALVPEGEKFMYQIPLVGTGKEKSAASTTFGGT